MAQAAQLVLSVGWAVRAVQCQQRPYDAILMCRHAPVLIADTKRALLPNLYCKGKLSQHDGQQRIKRDALCTRWATQSLPRPGWVDE
jgi:hypothetical protein